MAKKFTEDDKNRNFVQLNRDFMMDVAKLGTEKPSALSVFMFISQNMDGNNALCISMKALEEALGLSRSTLSRAVKYLEKKGWLCILKTGTSNVYIINPDIEWTSWANQKQYCKFQTNVIVSASENIDFMKNPKATGRYKYVDDNFIKGVKESHKAYEERISAMQTSFDPETGEIYEDEPFYG